MPTEYESGGNYIACYFKGGDYYEGRRVSKGDAGEVPSYTAAIEQAGGPRTIVYVYTFLSRADETKDKSATGKIRQQLRTRRRAATSE